MMISIFVSSAFCIADSPSELMSNYSKYDYAILFLLILCVAKLLKYELLKQGYNNFSVCLMTVIFIVHGIKCLYIV
jgi:hypothetical protein